MKGSSREMREALKRQRQIAKLLKDVSKIQDQNRAKLEVEAYEAEMAVLLTVHHQSASVVDWSSLAFALPPHPPIFHSRNHASESLAKFALLRQGSEADAALAEKWKADEEHYYLRYTEYQRQHAEWMNLKHLALRILEGNADAYGEAIQVFEPFSDLAELGSELSFKVRDHKRVSCTLRINGHGIIPVEIKTLTTAGKLSVKPMPKGRFHDLYQDYACGCCLRVGREILALLPVEYVLVTIQVEAVDPATGNSTELPILSVLLDRTSMGQLSFSTLDPSDSLINFTVRGDVKLSKKTGTFTAIKPLSYDELSVESVETEQIDSLRRRITLISQRFDKALRNEKISVEKANVENE